MYDYPVTLTPDPDGGFVVTFPDVPEAITQGDTREEALAHARDALETALVFYLDDRRPVPAPSAPDGRRCVAPEALVCAKLALHEALRAQAMTKADLGRRLGWHPPQVDRVLDIAHASKLDQVETALAALGRELVIGVRDAA
jgi:antitoxin HicB